MPTYINTINTFFFLHFELRSDPDPGKFFLDPHPCLYLEGIYLCTWQVYTSVHSRYIPLYLVGIYPCTQQVYTPVPSRYIPLYLVGIYLCTQQVYTPVPSRSFCSAVEMRAYWCYSLTCYFQLGKITKLLRIL